jgi:hypothetical protein
MPHRQRGLVSAFISGLSDLQTELIQFAFLFFFFGEIQNKQKFVKKAANKK